MMDMVNTLAQAETKDLFEYLLHNQPLSPVENV